MGDNLPTASQPWSRLLMLPQMTLFPGHDLSNLGQKRKGQMSVKEDGGIVPLPLGVGPRIRGVDTRRLLSRGSSSSDLP